MDLQQAVKYRILNLCNERQITLNKLATLSGMPQSTLNSLIDGTSKNPTLLTILRICLGLNIELKDFFDDKVFFDLDDE
ncbi:helix-turn-helix domain-containing protein [Massilioclostridium coli]|uniref:helix-turn-helix domain-containing protein n=1 Tax=Massilioclostridium coli TaxID=1870991 RepID=UPI00085BD8F3|nr:helix-turn-helix transcriptional regulator [Massilioclostridium coli]